MRTEPFCEYPTATISCSPNTPRGTGRWASMSARRMAHNASAENGPATRSGGAPSAHAIAVPVSLSYSPRPHMRSPSGPAGGRGPGAGDGRERRDGRPGGGGAVRLDGLDAPEVRPGGQRVRREWRRDEGRVRDDRSESRVMGDLHAVRRGPGDEIPGEAGIAG